MLFEKWCREDTEQSETSLCCAVLSLKVPSGQADQKITRDHQLVNFTFKKKKKDSVIYQCYNPGLSSVKQVANCPCESSRPTKNLSGLLELDHVTLKFNLSAEEWCMAPLKKDVGNQMTQAGGTVDLRVSFPFKCQCLSEEPSSLPANLISSVPLKSPGTFQTCQRQIQNVKCEADLRFHLVKCSHFTGEKTKAQRGNT